MPSPARAKHRFTPVPDGGERGRDAKLKANEVYLGLKVRLGPAFFKNGPLTNAQLVRRLDAEARFWRERRSPGVPFMEELFRYLADVQRFRIENGAVGSNESSPDFSQAFGGCGSCPGDQMKSYDGEAGATMCLPCSSPSPNPMDRAGDGD